MGLRGPPATHLSVDGDGIAIRLCGGCASWKPWTEEHFHACARSPSGLQYWCKLCLRQNTEHRRATHPGLKESELRALNEFTNRRRAARKERLQRAQLIAETESNIGVVLEKITATWQKGKTMKSMKELREMIRPMRAQRNSAELSISERAEHIVGLRAKLHEKEVEAATFAGDVERIHGDYVNNGQESTVAEFDRAQANLDRAKEMMRGLQMEIARVEREQVNAKTAEQSAAHRARVARVETKRAAVVDATRKAHELAVELADAYQAILRAEGELAHELGNDSRRGIPRIDASTVLALTLWSRTSGLFPPSGLQPASSPYVVGRDLQPLPDQWEAIAPLILAAVRSEADGVDAHAEPLAAA